MADKTVAKERKIPDNDPFVSNEEDDDEGGKKFGKINFSINFLVLTNP